MYNHSSFNTNENMHRNKTVTQFKDAVKLFFEKYNHKQSLSPIKNTGCVMDFGS